MKISLNLETSRLSLEMTKTAKERIVSLITRTDATSMTEVIRRALSVYDVIVKHIAEGGTIILKKDGNPDEKLILG